MQNRQKSDEKNSLLMNEDHFMLFYCGGMGHLGVRKNESDEFFRSTSFLFRANICQMTRALKKYQPR